ncbi:MAG TPA: hypothetical protein VE993_14765, partial [Stellaceae bacterium]|nr:hypothetical protein [Stellaceae bacterium]
LHHARAIIAAGAARLDPVEPWPHRYGKAFRALCARPTSALKPYLAQVADELARLFPPPAATAK